jgi:peptide/nickel transport system ATP-binding protein
MQSNNLLEVKNLEIQFRSENQYIKAVDGISFTIEKGETVGIVGESGSGKSITALSILGLLPKTAHSLNAGSINFQSKNGVNHSLQPFHSALNQRIRGKEIGMIFQEPMTSLNPVMTIGAQVSETLFQHLKLPKRVLFEHVKSLFLKVSLPQIDELWHKYPHQLSGGQKQRVMIAMAISCQPSLLIADEPTTALDVTIQASILELLTNLQQEAQMSMLFISHDMAIIGQMAKKILVMYNGKIVESGITESIFSNPQHPYTKSLLSCRPTLSKRWRRLPQWRTQIDLVDKNNSDANLTENQLATNSFLQLTSEEIASREEKISKAPLLLSVQNLTVSYPTPAHWLSFKTSKKSVVKNISFQVKKGEIVGLVGESGCGKTTLGRCISGLINPDSGTIEYENNSILLLNKKEDLQNRKKIQYLFQDPYSSLNPRLTIGEAILEPMLVHRIVTSKQIGKEKVCELLQKVQLNASHYNRYPHEFSGGQRQRIGIARALSLEPDFLVCDEPVSALDVNVQAQVLNLLMDLRNEYNFSALFISHDLSIVKFMSDRMLIMKDGEIIEEGNSEDMYLHPKQAYTKALIAAIPKDIN